MLWLEFEFHDSQESSTWLAGSCCRVEKLRRWLGDGCYVIADAPPSPPDSGGSFLLFQNYTHMCVLPSHLLAIASYTYMKHTHTWSTHTCMKSTYLMYTDYVHMYELEFFYHQCMTNIGAVFLISRTLYVACITIGTCSPPHMHWDSAPFLCVRDLEPSCPIFARFFLYHVHCTLPRHTPL